MSDHDTMADFKHPMTVDVKGVVALDKLAELERRHAERKVKLNNYFQVVNNDMICESREPTAHEWAKMQQELFDADQKTKTQGGFTPRKNSDMQYALSILYGVTIPFMTGIAAGTGSPWNEALGLGIIWPLWIPFEVGKAIGRVLELLP